MMILCKGSALSYHRRWVSPPYSNGIFGDSTSEQATNVLSLDPSLRDLTERVLPLGTYYTAISTFVESRSHLDFGLVNHALCAAIRDMLKVRHPVSKEAFQTIAFLHRSTRPYYPSWNTHSIHRLNSPCRSSGSISIQRSTRFL